MVDRSKLMEPGSEGNRSLSRIQVSAEGLDDEPDTGTPVSTVILLDLSRSLWYGDVADQTMDVARALVAELRAQSPGDEIDLIGFSNVAKRIELDELSERSYSDAGYGTNLQHALQIAREILSTRQRGQKRIILITDGEATAHLEGTDVFFRWPPVLKTVLATLREADHCTDEGIRIDTFVPDLTSRWGKFIGGVTRDNGGQILTATLESVTAYVAADAVGSSDEANEQPM